MKLKDLNLGFIDAKNELLADSPEERKRFKAAFVVPPSLDIAKYTSGERYFVSGLKGTGKTALLRFISLKIEEETGISSSFVLFKTDLNEDLKKSFAQASRDSQTLQDTAVEANSIDFSGDDFENVWRWFIYRKLATVLQEEEVELFQHNSDYYDFLSVVSSPAQDQSTGLKALIPKIKKGKIEISKDPKIDLELEWDSKGIAKLQFNKLVEQADNKFDKLLPSSDGINIFFDELELNHNTKKQYDRDSRLIRDLIVTIEKINGLSKRKGLPLTIYSAIRSEVQNSVQSLGKEINKILSDFGTEIIWNRPGLDVHKQPLLNIITKRLYSNLYANQDYKEDLANNVWDIFFQSTVQGKDVREYILHNSWYRPRDIVRLLKIAQDQHPDEESFKHHVFDSIRKKYSEQSWIEITEELKSKYRSDDIEGIKRLFYGVKQHFTFNYIRERQEEIKQLYPEIEKLLSTYSIQEIISDLYRVGVIGNNENGRIRFSFRGDDEILLEQTCFIHNALKAHLSIK